MESSIRSKIDTLRDDINRHNVAYYVDGRPTISDRAYDRMFAELQTLEAEYPAYATADSPTTKVGGQGTGKRTITHTSPMLSLDNTYTYADVDQFTTRMAKLLSDKQIEYVVEPKVDGVSVVIRYENHRLKYLATRGDGIVGTDITHIAQYIADLPLFVPNDLPDVMEFRGEAYIDKHTFKMLNEMQAKRKRPLFANSRNLCAGTLNHQDESVIQERNVRVIAYQLIHTSSDLPIQHTGCYNLMDRLQLPNLGSTCQVVMAGTLHDTLQKFEARKDTYNFDIDGAVIKLNELRYHTQLGTTSRAPIWAVAYKFETEKVTTTILDITLQVGRSGIITPVAELAPVTVAGTVVSRATLHNFDYIAEKDIRIGDHVIIEKAGEIIPAVVRVDFSKRKHDSVEYVAPTKCPSCSSILHRADGSSGLYCMNNYCPDTVITRIAHFTGKQAMDIDGLGIAMITKLVASGIISDVADIYELDDRKYSNMCKLEGVGNGTVDKLKQSIADSTGRPLWRLIHGLGIPHVGKRTAQTIVSACPSLDALLHVTKAELLKLNDIGDRVADSVRIFMGNHENVQLLQRLHAAGVNTQHVASEVVSNPYTGKRFAVTGALQNTTKSEIQEKLAKIGAVYTTSVSGTTDYLVVGTNPGGKLTKATKLGVPTITEQILADMLDS